MPHTKSLSNRKQRALVGREKKWGKIVHDAIPSLYNTVRSSTNINYMRIHTLVGAYRSHPYSSSVLESTLSEKAKSSNSCNIYMVSDRYASYHVVIPFGKFQKEKEFIPEDIVIDDTGYYNTDTVVVNKIRAIIYEWFMDLVDREFCKRKAVKTQFIKEELISQVWKPSRVESWLEAGIDLETL